MDNYVAGNKFNSNEPSQKVVVYFWTNLAILEQGQGLDQQRDDFTTWQKSNSCQLVAEFTDTFLKRTKPKHFPELAKAVEFCVNNNAKLVIAKLNGLIGQKEFADLLATSYLDFVCLDKTLVTPDVLAVVRQYVEEQSKQHGNSIKRGLKLTSNKLGNPNAAKSISPFNRIKTENAIMFALLLAPVIETYKQQGMSQRKMVTALNESGIVAPEGGKWVLSQLQKVLKRIDANNLALNYTNEVLKDNYKEYSSVELISSLNHGGFKPHYQDLWDQEAINQVEKRTKSINDVIELYGFIQAYSHTVNDSIKQGNTLSQIAQLLNNNACIIPNVLVESLENNKQLIDLTWDEKLVEELIKRMNNAICLPYSHDVMKNFENIITEYANHETNSKAKEVYQNPIVHNLLQPSSNMSPNY